MSGLQNPRKFGGVAARKQPLKRAFRRRQNHAVEKHLLIIPHFLIPIFSFIFLICTFRRRFRRHWVLRGPEGPTRAENGAVKHWRQMAVHSDELRPNVLLRPVIDS